MAKLSISPTSKLELIDNNGVVVSFELALLITAVLFGFFLLWWCALSSTRSRSQPTRYVYSGDTVATDDDEREECDGEDQIHSPKRQQRLKSIIPPEIVCADGSDGGSHHASVASMVFSISGASDRSDRDNFDSAV